MAAKDADDRKPDDQDAEISLDMSQTAVKKMISEAREKGYITYDQLNHVLPPDQVSSEQIEDVMEQLSKSGINVVETWEDHQQAKVAFPINLKAAEQGDAEAHRRVPRRNEV